MLLQIMIYLVYSIYGKPMFSDEIKKLLFQVITSWQVLTVTVVLVLYVFLVNYVARTHHHRRQFSLPKAKKSAAAAPAPSAPSETDELGLEEKKPPGK